MADEDDDPDRRVMKRNLTEATRLLSRLQQESTSGDGIVRLRLAVLEILIGSPAPVPTRTLMQSSFTVARYSVSRPTFKAQVIEYLRAQGLRLPGLQEGIVLARSRAQVMEGLRTNSINAALALKRRAGEMARLEAEIGAGLREELGLSTRMFALLDLAAHLGEAGGGR